MNMYALIGRIATITCTVILFTGAIAFNLSQAATWYDALNLCASSIALEFFGAVIFTTCYVSMNMEDEHGNRYGAKPIHLLMIIFGIALVFYSTVVYQFYETQSDARLSETSVQNQTAMLKLDLAQSKVKMLETGKVDINQAANQLAAMEKAAANCKHAWSWSCKDKARAGKNAIELKLNAQKESVEAISEALATVKEVENNNWQKAPDYAKHIAILFLGGEENALKAQAMFRWFKSILLNFGNCLGFVMFSSNDKRYINLAKKVINKSNTQHDQVNQPFSPAPQQSPIMAIKNKIPTGEYFDAIARHKFTPTAKSQNKIVSLAKTPREPVRVSPNIGTSELFEDDLINDESIAKSVNTTSPTILKGMGLLATEIPNPDYIRPVSLAKKPKREQVFTPAREPAFTVECEPESVNREPSKRQAREHQKSFADLADEIVNGSVFRGKKISLRAIKDFMACRTEIAREFRNRLINEQIINNKGEVCHG